MYVRASALLVRARWAIVFVWALILSAAAFVAPQVFTALEPGGFSSPDFESQRAAELLTRRFGYYPGTLVVLFSAPPGSGLRNDQPEFVSEMNLALEQVRALPDVEFVTTPREIPRQASEDGTTAYAAVALRMGPEQFRIVLPRVREALRPTRLEQAVTGAPVFFDDIQRVTERDLRRAEIVSLPLAIIALLIVFRSAIAAGLPVLVGGAAVLITVGTMVELSRFFPMSIFALNLVTMLGLGLGIDYALFVVSRFREELGAGLDVPSALAQTMNTAGRSVFFSGATVLVGLSALTSFNVIAIRSLGVAGSILVFACVLAAITLLPAVLAILGPNVDRFAVPILVLGRRAKGKSVPEGPAVEGRAWATLANWVMAHPLRVLIPVVATLLVLGVPFLRVELGAPDASVLPQDVPSRRGFDLLREKYGEGELSPILITLTADGPMLTPARVAQLYDFAQRIGRDPQVARVESAFTLDPRLTREQYQILYARPDRIPDPYAAAAVQASVREGTVLIRATSRSGQTDPASKELVRRLRSLTPPSGMSLLVGGGTAGVLDYAEGLYKDFPRALGFVVASTYLLLFLLFRSAILPIKAILMNLLSITASFGALVIVFQDGALADLLGFTPLGFVEASLPIVLFCLLFGVSMDYEVFLLSRVKEAFDGSGDNRRSVAEGLARSGGIITSAAAIIVLVSGAFMAADIVLIKALALGGALAVLLDATLVRALLVPATMRLLGNWNWWAPGRPRRDVSPSAKVEA
jgi:RND superfamily putative drug exporter